MNRTAFLGTGGAALAGAGLHAPWGRTLEWSDEFEYEGLPDPSKWTYDVGGGGWGNNELEYYTDARLSNASVSGGKLHITARHETYDGMAYTSARLVSRASWKYVRIDVRAKMPGGRGTWPAIWMFPQRQRYGQDPRSGEIDIVENVGYDPYMIYPSIHTQKFDSEKKTITSSKRCTTVDSEYHVYSVDWTPTGMDILFDGAPYLRYHPSAAELRRWEAWPYNEPFFLILNVAVGGSWGGLYGVDAAAFPRTLSIDYVRVYS